MLYYWGCNKRKRKNRQPNRQHNMCKIRKAHRIVYVIRKVPGNDDQSISAKNRKQTRRKPQRWTQ